MGKNRDGFAQRMSPLESHCFATEKHYNRKVCRNERESQSGRKEHTL